MSILESGLTFNQDGLIPAIVQDYQTKDVLMLAYMSEASIKETEATGFATYFSRSRQELWKKGATSGHLQKVRSLSFDCDKDALLLQVDQTGVACHNGTWSCFEGVEPSQSVLEKVFQILQDRKANPKEGSYTTYLFEKGIDKILKKVGEESAEIIIGAKNEGIEEMVAEISDLVYHVSVLMVEKGATLQDVEKVLKGRMGAEK